jgi:hypothetical protein
MPIYQSPLLYKKSELTDLLNLGKGIMPLQVQISTISYSNLVTCVPTSMMWNGNQQQLK